MQNTVSMSRTNVKDNRRTACVVINAIVSHSYNCEAVDKKEEERSTDYESTAESQTRIGTERMALTRKRMIPV